LAELRQLAISAKDPLRLAAFYQQVFELKRVYESRQAICLSDGKFNLALLYQRPEEKLNLNHFGFHVHSIEEMRQRAEQAGISQGAKRPDRIPFAEVRLHDPEGNGIDISVKGWKT
jgi:catechol-2,3-dioxygenase